MEAESLAASRAVRSRILIADDHSIFRSGLRDILMKQPDLEVVGEAATGQEAIELCYSLRPELVLMDMRMPDVDGVAATHAIKRKFPETIVLVLTAVEDTTSLSQALEAGAAGYVLKEIKPRQLVDSVRGVLNGESPLDEGMGMQLLQRLLEEKKQGPPKERTLPEDSTSSAQPLLPEPLTARELEVLRLVAQGQSNQQIAKSLLISTSTVKNHMRYIISKLGVSDRTQAAIKAMELGLLADRDE